MRQVRVTVNMLGAAAGLLAAMAVSTTTAEAMPVASAPANVVGAPLVDARYYGRPYRYHRRRAGVYRCGPYAFKTHLSRKYCR